MHKWPASRENAAAEHRGTPAPASTHASSKKQVPLMPGEAQLQFQLLYACVCFVRPVMHLSFYVIILGRVINCENMRNNQNMKREWFKKSWVAINGTVSTSTQPTSISSALARFSKYFHYGFIYTYTYMYVYTHTYLKFYNNYPLVLRKYGDFETVLKTEVLGNGSRSPHLGKVIMYFFYC